MLKTIGQALARTCLTSSRENRMKRIFIFGLIVTALWLAACSAQPTATPLPPLPTATSQAIATPTSQQPTVAPSSASSSVIEISDADNGKTFTTPVGARVRIVLHSTYWQFDKVSNSALKQQGEPIVTPDTTVRIPGTGAGTVTVEFQTVALGQATIKASRTTCGEALLCAENQRSFQVTLIIK